MDQNFLHYPILPIALKIGVAVGIGMLIGMERKWSHKEAGIRTFSIVALLGMLSEVISQEIGGLQPSEIRSAILLGLIGFVIYPLMPDRYLDRWGLFNPGDAWLSVIAISGIGFVNYVFLRVLSTGGLYLGAIFGGLVNSSATVAEISSRAETGGLISKVTTLCLLTTIAMFVRNLLLVGIFSPASLPAALLPLLAMSLVSAFWIWHDIRHEPPVIIKNEIAASPEIDTPISLKKVLGFGLLFVLVQVGGTLLTRLFGSYGMLAAGIFGGFASSASTTAAAATMASHGHISASIAGSVAILSSLASAVINLPIIWRLIKERAIVKKTTIELSTVILTGVIITGLDQAFKLTERLMQLYN